MLPTRLSIPTWADAIDSSASGCYRRKGTDDEIIQVTPRSLRIGDCLENTGFKVWYPLTNENSFISMKYLESYELCSATEIERIRRQRDANEKKENTVLSLDNARQTRYQKEHEADYQKIAALADHLS